MINNNTEDVLSSIVEILKHIDSVHKEVQELSERAMVSFQNFFEDNKLKPDEKALRGFQFHDIISQQISAISETIIMIEKNISIYLHAVKEDQHMLGESINKLSTRLTKSLLTAKEKQDAFSGNALDPNHGESLSFF